MRAIIALACHTRATLPLSSLQSGAEASGAACQVRAQDASLLPPRQLALPGFSPRQLRLAATPLPRPPARRARAGASFAAKQPGTARALSAPEISRRALWRLLLRFFILRHGH